MINEFNHLATDMILKALAHELAESKNGIRKNALHTAIQIVKLYHGCKFYRLHNWSIFTTRF